MRFIQQPFLKTKSTLSFDSRGKSNRYEWFFYFIINSKKSVLFQWQKTTKCWMEMIFQLILTLVFWKNGRTKANYLPPPPQVLTPLFAIVFLNCSPEATLKFPFVSYTFLGETTQRGAHRRRCCYSFVSLMCSLFDILALDSFLLTNPCVTRQSLSCQRCC